MPPGEYWAPDTLDQAISLLAENAGRAVLLAGGTDLMPRINRYKLKPQAIIHLGRIGLDFLREEGGQVHIGATCTTAALAASPWLEERAPILVSAARHSASPAVRNTATLGGNLASAHPGADLATPLLALEAQAHLAGPEGEGTLPLEKFFLGRRQTVLRADQMLTSVSFPLPGPGWSFKKLGRRRANTLSVVNVAVQLELDQGRCRHARLALGSMGPTPLRCHLAEELLTGARWSPDLWEQAAQAALQTCDPKSDVHGSAWYRSRTARVLLVRALEEAGRRSQGGGADNAA
jgi:carbon-monoxide dehydrogenase medium subunit